MRRHERGPRSRQLREFAKLLRKTKPDNAELYRLRVLREVLMLAARRHPGLQSTLWNVEQGFDVERTLKLKYVLRLLRQYRKQSGKGFAP